MNLKKRGAGLNRLVGFVFSLLISMTLYHVVSSLVSFFFSLGGNF